MCSIHIFSFFLSCFFSFSIGIFRDRHWRFISWDMRGNNYVSCFPLPPGNENLFNSSRFLSLIFTRSICNYQIDSWWDLFSLGIFILFTFLWMQLSQSIDFSRWHWEDLSSYQGQLLQTGAKFITNWGSYYKLKPFQFNRFPKCIRNKGCLIFFYKWLEDE